MKPLPTHTFEFEFLTPCFSGTAEGKNADSSVLRVSPIRGHIRMWHASLFGATDANAVWGSTAGDGCGSKVGVTLKNSPPASKTKAEILPHELKKSSPKVSLPADSHATLVLTRLPGCNSTQWEHAEKATKLWLLLGTLGLRSARAAGSVWPLGAWVPSDEGTLKSALLTLGLRNVSVSAAGLSAGADAYTLRETASDTVDEKDIFGSIKGGRYPSPTKFKVARMGAGYCLIVTAEQRPVTVRSVTKPMIQHAEFMLSNKHQPSRWKALGAWQPLLP